MAEDQEPRSPLADEAARLVGAMQNWARQGFPPASGHGGPDGHEGPDCRWCPLCQFVAVLRGERPEVSERVAEAGTALGAALRAVLDAASSGVGAKDDDPPRPPRVQRIDLGKSRE